MTKGCRLLFLLTLIVLLAPFFCMHHGQVFQNEMWRQWGSAIQFTTLRRVWMGPRLPPLSSSLGFYGIERTVWCQESSDVRLTIRIYRTSNAPFHSKFGGQAICMTFPHNFYFPSSRTLSIISSLQERSNCEVFVAFKRILNMRERERIQEEKKLWCWWWLAPFFFLLFSQFNTKIKNLNWILLVLMCLLSNFEL